MITNKGNKTSEIILLFGKVLVCFFILISITYMWYHIKNFEGKAIEYRKSLAISSKDGIITNYIGTPNNGDIFSIDYTLLTGYDVTWNEIKGVTSSTENSQSFGFVASQLYPGCKVYFKTDITNTTTREINVSLFLLNIQYDLPLNNYLTIVENEPESHYADLGSLATINDKTDTCTVSRCRVTEDVSIPANSTRSVYWYIEVDSGAGNDCKEAELSFTSIQVQTGS